MWVHNGKVGGFNTKQSTFSVSWGCAGIGNRVYSFQITECGASVSNILSICFKYNIHLIQNMQINCVLLGVNSSSVPVTRCIPKRLPSSGLFMTDSFPVEAGLP